MAQKSKKSVAKCAAVTKSIDSAIETLTAASSDSEKPVEALSKIAKSLSGESKRFSKKRGTLARRKKATAAKLKKNSDAATTKLLKTTEKELAAIKKLAAKTNAAKSANSEELKGLKVQAKRSKVYISLLEKADRVLNKPKKKKRKKRAKKATA